MDAGAIETDATLVIIAGGAGRRLGGVEKALVEMDGRPLVAAALELAPRFASALLVAEPTPGLVALGLPVVPDRIPGRGAPGGVWTGLLECETEWAFVVACDMPTVRWAAVERLWAARERADAVVPEVDGRRHPLHALYRVAAAAPLAESIVEEQASLRALSERLAARAVTLQGLEESVRNVNTPEELVAARARSRGRG